MMNLPPIGQNIFIITQLTEEPENVPQQEGGEGRGCGANSSWPAGMEVGLPSLEDIDSGPEDLWGSPHTF